jgi:hypothetical protein
MFGRNHPLQTRECLLTPLLKRNNASQRGTKIQQSAFKIQHSKNHPLQTRECLLTPLLKRNNAAQRGTKIQQSAFIIQHSKLILVPFPINLVFDNGHCLDVRPNAFYFSVGHTVVR